MDIKNLNETWKKCLSQRDELVRIEQENKGKNDKFYEKDEHFKQLAKDLYDNCCAIDKEIDNIPFNKNDSKSKSEEDFKFLFYDAYALSLYWTAETLYSRDDDIKLLPDETIDKIRELYDECIAITVKQLNLMDEVDGFDEMKEEAWVFI